MLHVSMLMTETNKSRNVSIMTAISHQRSSSLHYFCMKVVLYFLEVS